MLLPCSSWRLPGHCLWWMDKSRAPCWASLLLPLPLCYPPSSQMTTQQLSLNSILLCSPGPSSLSVALTPSPGVKTQPSAALLTDCYTVPSFPVFRLSWPLPMLVPCTSGHLHLSFRRGKSVSHSCDFYLSFLQMSIKGIFCPLIGNSKSIPSFTLGSPFSLTWIYFLIIFTFTCHTTCILFYFTFYWFLVNFISCTPSPPISPSLHIHPPPSQLPIKKTKNKKKIENRNAFLKIETVEAVTCHSHTCFITCLSILVYTLFCFLTF